MPTALQGKVGLWCHLTPTIEGHLHTIQGLGFDYIALKIGDSEGGAHLYDPADYQAVLAAAKTIELPVVPWGYFTPANAIAMADMLADWSPIQEATDLIIDAESEWEYAGSGAVADGFAHHLAERLEHRTALHLSTFYWPQGHPQFPFGSFLRHCSSFMPQSYVEGNTPGSIVLVRTEQSARPAAQQSLDKLLIPTYNDASLLASAPRYDGASVWLWEQDDTESVIGHQAEYKQAIGAHKP